MNLSKPAKLRKLIEDDAPHVVPLVLDPIDARLAEEAGFQALYLGGGAMGYAKAVTEANITLTEMIHAGLEIAAVSHLPLILDGTCGWGDPMHVHRTVSMAEAAGFAAIEIEDQILPKRAHHHIGVEHLVSRELMVQKVEEAVAARRDPDFVIIARTNACRTHGIEEAVRRAESYRQAGADMLFVLLEHPSQAREIGELIEGPLLYMMRGGPSSVDMSHQELKQFGYALIGDGTTPFLVRHKAMRLCYEALASGKPDRMLDEMYKSETEKVHETVNLDRLLDIERRTVENSDNAPARHEP